MGTSSILFSTVTKYAARESMALQEVADIKITDPFNGV